MHKVLAENIELAWAGFRTRDGGSNPLWKWKRTPNEKAFKQKASGDEGAEHIDVELVQHLRILTSKSKL